MAKEIKALVAQIKKGHPKPLYLLFGEEPYFIDKMCQFIADNVLLEEERAFNQMVVYGKDSSIDEVVAHAKRYPMMAERQVLLIKEAQQLYKTIDQLLRYALKPQPSTGLENWHKPLKLDYLT